MRALLVLLMSVLLLVPAVPANATSLIDEKLPTDPALVMGTLPNGLAYIIRPHRNPEGRVTIWLHVASGSFNDDSTRGLAHYLEHMAFNGSANFPPGSVVPFFQSLGLSFGRDQNAFTSFDQTTYQLTLPGGGRELVEKGLLYMSDVGFRLNLTAAEIDSEPQVILEEKRARSSAQQRVQDQVYERLAPESTLGRPLPASPPAASNGHTARAPPNPIYPIPRSTKIHLKRLEVIWTPPLEPTASSLPMFTLRGTGSWGRSWSPPMASWAS